MLFCRSCLLTTINRAHSFRVCIGDVVVCDMTGSWRRCMPQLNCMTTCCMTLSLPLRSQTCGLLTTCRMVNYVHAFTQRHGVTNDFWPLRRARQSVFVAGKEYHCGLLHAVTGPGQPRLDSGSLSAGWFPLPDAVRGLLGCHPSAPLQFVFVDLRAALGHVDCCRVDMR